jgi:GTP-binding protein LepA
MDLNRIRNFSIIAHIDHGKSTLADRLLEETSTIEKRKMRAQVLDSMDLERERGITIKMQPVRMSYEQAGQQYELNLIDTPGHIDFSYEVSRSLKAVEGVILLVDATQGVQAQTFTVLDMAKDLKLKVIPVLNKIDLPAARPDEIEGEVMKLVGCERHEILRVSGKTGEGVGSLLEAIVERIPPPTTEYPDTTSARALVFDFEYSPHRGIIVYLRLLDGAIKAGDSLQFVASKENFVVQEVGIFTPTKQATSELTPGAIGYMVTAIKKPGETRVGDTITRPANPLPQVPGYMSPKPVVWASIYPESQDDFTLLRQALERLYLSDSALSFEEESSGSLGRGFRAGFLGMLHLEIITERLKREFNLTLVVATPTISYTLVDDAKGTKTQIYSPHLFPEDTKGTTVLETWVNVKLISPSAYLGSLIPILHDHEAEITETETFSDNRTALSLEMPLRELMRNFFDEVKSASSGFASLAYQITGERAADVVRLDILINGEVVAAFTRVVARIRVQREAEEAVTRLKNLLPKQLIMVKIQGRALGRILSADTISAMRKDVTDYLYGGDITRKMKLREKQKKGKKKMQQRGKVNIPEDVFLKMMRSQ